MNDVVELVPGSLYRLGGRVPLDGRISWVPDGATGWDSVNCYLLREGGSALLVDTGIALHADQTAAALESLLDPGTRLSVYLTRMEADTVTGLGTVLSRVRVDTVWAGGTANPFDYFDDLNSSEMMRANYQAGLRRLPGDELFIGEARRLEVIRPPLRLLNTTWVFDEGTGTLFTSDVFGHARNSSPDGPLVIDAQSDSVTEDDIRAHLLTKFAYLDGAKTRSIVSSLDELFAEHEVQRIAPTQGCVLNDAATVARHAKAFRSILEDVDAGTA